MSFFGINFGQPDNATRPESTPSDEMLPHNTSALSHESSFGAHAEHEMTKEEVNKLVHNALLRARKATTPNRSSKKSSSDALLTSPLSSFGGGDGSSVAPDSPPRIKHHQISASLQDIIKVGSDDTHRDMDALLSPTMDSGMDCERSVSTQRSLLSNDSVLRKVEAEIANAKKAARATARKINRMNNDEGLQYDEISSSCDNDDLTDILNDHLADDEDLQNILNVEEDAEFKTSDLTMQQQFVATPVQARNHASVPSSNASEVQLQIKYNPEPRFHDTDNKMEVKDGIVEVFPANHEELKERQEATKNQIPDINDQDVDIHEALEVSIDDVVLNENKSTDDIDGLAPELISSSSGDLGHDALQISVEESEIEIQHSPQRKGKRKQNNVPNGPEKIKSTISGDNIISSQMQSESKADPDGTKKNGFIGTVTTSSYDRLVEKSVHVEHHVSRKDVNEESVSTKLSTLSLEEKKVDLPLDEIECDVIKSKGKEIDPSDSNMSAKEITGIKNAAEYSNQEDALDGDKPVLRQAEEQKGFMASHPKDGGMKKVEEEHASDLFSGNVCVQQVSNLGFSEDSNDNAQDKENSPIMKISSVNSSGNQEITPETLDLNSGKVQFRHPYPYPPPLPKPRSAPEIINDHKLGIPQHFSKWSKPSQDLEKLFSASQGESLHRRSNACGALKILSQKKKNQLALVRTRGFLDALAFAIAARIPNNRGRDVALDSRARGVSTLLNVTGPKDNRLLIGIHPGVIASLRNVLEEDQGEARVQAGATLALLAKTKENREFMAEVPRLLDVLAQVLDGSIDDLLDEEDDDEEYDDDDEEIEDSDDHCTDDENKDDSELEATDCENDGFSADGTNSFYSGAEDDTENLENEDSNEDTSIDGSSASSVLVHSKRRAKQKSIRSQKNALLSQYIRQARINVCATLMHLTKHCAILVSRFLFYQISNFICI